MAWLALTSVAAAAQAALLLYLCSVPCLFGNFGHAGHEVEEKHWCAEEQCVQGQRVCWELLNLILPQKEIIVKLQLQLVYAKRV